jgi:DnaJ-class molecular chaperone
MSTKFGERPNYNSFKVIACYNCKGDGVWYSKHTTDYHRGEYDTKQHICHLCEGSGLLTENIEVTYAPFKQSVRWKESE